ncbi:MAG: SycD/LcrH family type III secretion system chaperone [Verrucomicrobiae bacterium]|nr:SycD/LcrH family type III secretion system chaperone [Verrucomicrobiae bacterium]
MTENKNQARTSLKDSAKKMEETFKPLLTQGVPLYLSRGLTEQDLDALYIIAYNLYSEKKYQRAVKIFETISFYNHFDKRGWIGTAACYQVLGRYNDAILCYSSASLIDIEDPLPIFHSIECYIVLKRYSEARSALEVILLLTQENDEFANLKNWAMKMKETLGKANA